MHVIRELQLALWHSHCHDQFGLNEIHDFESLGAVRVRVTNNHVRHILNSQQIVLIQDVWLDHLEIAINGGCKLN